MPICRSSKVSTGMEQFRQIGEALGSLKALMVFRDNIRINQRQCLLLLDIFSFAYDTIVEEMKQNLRFEEKHVKWRSLEQPLREIYRIFKEGEGYVEQCLETKDSWARAIVLYQSMDCVELYIHNLLTCIPIVIEAIEIAGEFSGCDKEEMQNKRLLCYQKQGKVPQLFQWKFGKQYLITQDFCNRFDMAWKEDRWILLNKIREKKISGTNKHDQQLVNILWKNLEESEPSNGKLLPCSILVDSKDYQVRRRLGNGSQFKEILWLGESFVLRHFFGRIETLIPEISLLLSLSHPNTVHYLCGFADGEMKECFLVMEMMNRDLSNYIKEICGPRKRIPFSLPVVVDLMLQIARGMEYLHSKKIYHGNLNPSNILIKQRSIYGEGYLHAKVSGFGLHSVKNFSSKGSLDQKAALSFIWHAPEVLEEQEQLGSEAQCRYTEKADVYSFGMVCFELLTGKVPFEDSHLHGDKMSRNIRAGERPLFPFNSSKYVTNITKKCWHTDPNQRPSFSSICRILRCTKRFIIMNPDHNREPDPPMPLVDYTEMETKLLQKFPSWDSTSLPSVAQIPFQMFVYRVNEEEKSKATQKETSESGSDRASISGDEVAMDDPFPSPTEKQFLASPKVVTNKKPQLSNKSLDARTSKQPGTPKARSVRPPQLTPCGRRLRVQSESQLNLMSPRMRGTSSGHASDSELS